MNKAAVKHKWTFTSRFRKGAYGWKGTRPACQRLKEALSEIKKAGRKDPLLAGEGAVILITRLVPAIEHIDGSSGMIGAHVYNAVEALVAFITGAGVDDKTRVKWLDKLWNAYSDDGFGYLENLGEHWGELCSTRDLCNEWIDKFMVIVGGMRDRRETYSYFNGTIPCLSCMLQSGRYHEILELLHGPVFKMWHYRKYGVKALTALGKKGEALEFAEASRGLNEPDWQIDSACEEILKADDRHDEAYRRYALTRQTKSSYSAWFRDIVKRYPAVPPGKILSDLIESSGVDKGKWFAAAKDLKRYDLAVQLAQDHPCEPATLNRAAKTYLHLNTPFSLHCSLASLKWMFRGYGYEITGSDISQALDNAFCAAELDGRTEMTSDIISKLLDQSPGVDTYIADMVRKRLAKTTGNL